MLTRVVHDVDKTARVVSDALKGERPVDNVDSTARAAAAG